jgi:hypothetical protein
MQLVERKIPGEVLILALLIQIFGSYFSIDARALLFNGLMIVLTLMKKPGVFNCSGKSMPKQGLKVPKITKPKSPPTSNKVTASKKEELTAPKKAQEEVTAVPSSAPASKVIASKKSQEQPTAIVKGPVTKTEAAPRKVESPPEDVKAVDKDPKEKVPKKKQRSRNSSLVEQQREAGPTPVTVLAPAPAEQKQVPTRKGKAAFSPGVVDVIMDMMKEPEKNSEPKASAASSPGSAPASKKPSSARPVPVAPMPTPTPTPQAAFGESELPVDWVEYWTEGRVAVPKRSVTSTKSKCEIAIQTVNEVEVQTEDAPQIEADKNLKITNDDKKVEKKRDLSESLARLPSLGLVENAPPLLPPKSPITHSQIVKPEQKSESGSKTCATYTTSSSCTKASSSC